MPRWGTLGLAAIVGLGTVPGDAQRTASAQTASSLRHRGMDALFKSASKQTDELSNENGPPGIVVAPGTQLYAGVAALHGVDVNKDQIVANSQSSSFSTLDLGVGLIASRGQSTTAALARGSLNTYDLDFRSDRSDYGALIDHTTKLTDRWTSSLGAFFLHDDIDVSRSDRTAGHISFNYDDTHTEGFLRTRALHREYLNNPGSPAPAGLLFDGEKAFSNTRIETSAGLLVGKESRIAPFGQIGVASIDFTHRVVTDPLPRDARDYWALAGLRFKFSDQIYLDAGARHTLRDFEQAGRSTYSNTSFDGKIVWTPSARLYAELGYDASFEDPLITGAYFTKRSGYSFYGEVRPAEKTFASLSVDVAEQNQIGANVRFDEINGEAKIGYRIAPMAEVFVIGGYQHAENRDTHETAESGRVGVGLKYGY